MDAIRRALEEDGSAFAAAALRALTAASPTALKLTLRLLRSGRASSSLEECLVRWSTGPPAGRFRGHDFFEGIRAAVIDKDKRPRWSPARLEDVGEAPSRICGR